MKKVSATEAQHNFNNYLSAAMSEPILISKNNEEEVIMLSRKQYGLLLTYKDAYRSLRDTGHEDLNCILSTKYE